MHKQTAMKDVIKQILFSHHQYSVENLQEKMKNGEVSYEDLCGLFGPSLSNVIQNYTPVSFPMGKDPQSQIEFNHIVFWGNKGSGKTSVIASLLSLPGMNTSKLNKGNQKRIKSFVATFKNTTDPQVIPQDCSSDSGVYYATYKKGHRSYYLSFIEANDSSENLQEQLNSAHVSGSHEKPQGLVHIFCIDCRGDLSAQIESHKNTINWLQTKKIMDKSTGVYILVTKADLMNAPKVYLDNAAQAMITASSQAFWQFVRQRCGDNDIYNEQPIVCSIGDFTLKDYAKLTSEYTSRLFHDYILRKCEHKHWGLVGLLRKMGTIKAVLLASLLVLVAGLGIYFALDAISKPPTRVLEPFDYKAFFDNEVAMNLAPDATFEKAREQYWILRNNLTVEGLLRKNNNEYVLTRNHLKDCDSNLSNAFAEIITNKLKSHFRTSAWTNDTSLLRHSLKDLQDLLNHKHVMRASNESICNEQLGYLKAYYDSILPLIGRDQNCRSVEALNDICDNVDHWNKVPFHNDSTLRKNLNNVVCKAYVSFSNSLFERASNIQDSYSRLPYYWDPQREKLKEKASDLCEIVKILLERIDEDEQKYNVQDYPEVKEMLKDTERVLSYML